MEGRPIPSFVTKSHVFRRIVAKLVSCACLGSLPVLERHALHKDILLEAAKLTREELLDTSLASCDCELMRLNTCARLVACNEVDLARRIVLRDRRMAKLLVVLDVGVVALREPWNFDKLFCLAKLEVIEAKKSILEGLPPSQLKVKTSRLQALFRMASVWKKQLPAVHLAGIIRPDKSVARDPAGKASCLSLSWSPVFGKVQENASEIDAFVAKHVRPWKLDAPPPSLRCFKKALDCVSDCGVGPDGLPYSAWRSAEGAETLWLLDAAFADGLAPPISFNMHLGAFLKKADHEDDCIEVLREAEATRPLGLKNSDNKVICRVNSRCWRRAMMENTCDIQRGFTWSRQLVANVVDMDSAARCLSNLGFHAWLAAFDFGTAFPSVGHVWLFSVLHSRNFPLDFVNKVAAKYHFCVSKFGSNGILVFL
jgi:hypothetical protein